MKTLEQIQSELSPQDLAALKCAVFDFIMDCGLPMPSNVEEWRHRVVSYRPIGINVLDTPYFYDLLRLVLDKYLP